MAATLGGIALPRDPDQVSWSYKAKTKITNTIGGKVVQVFGVSIDNMSVSGSYGQGGSDAQERFVRQVTGLAEQQADQIPHRLIIPARGWDFEVYVSRIRSARGEGVSIDPSEGESRWMLELIVSGDNIGLKKAATDDFISRLTKGLGFAPPEYNSNVLGQPFQETPETRVTWWGRLAGGGAPAYGEGGLDDALAGTIAPGQVNIPRILATIRQVESGNNYTITNPSPSSTASGAYQFINSTWGGYGGYATAAQAPPHVQDERARLDVERFLTMYNGVLEAVPAAWYTGTYRGAGKLNYHPGGANSLTVQAYVDKWMKIYMGGA